MKIYFRMIPVILAALLTVSCSFADKSTNGGEPEINGIFASDGTAHKVPELCGSIFDETLQQVLMNEGYILSVESVYDDNAGKGEIILQNPRGGTLVKDSGIKLKLTVSLGKEPQKKPDADGENVNKADSDKTADETNYEIKWIIPPQVDYDYIETFGMTGYSMCGKWGSHGVIDMSGKPYGTGDYSKLFYCPEHGLSSPDVKDVTVLSPDLSISPDCGFGTSAKSNNIYVYDDSRSRVYLTGYSDGVFRIADITDTEFFKSNQYYIAVLYNCDADLLMYVDAGMESLEDIFRAENTEMKYGVVSSGLDELVVFDYSEVREGNDCFIVKKDGKYGYVGTYGNVYYPCVFEQANTAYKGAAWVKYNGKWGTVRF